MKKNVVIIKEDVEIAESVYLSKGDMLIETSKGRWTLIESDDEDADDKEDKEEVKEEEDKADDEKKDDEKKEESKKRR
jgi:uncharacterized membrane protein YukC